jgi:hypothetical protein
MADAERDVFMDDSRWTPGKDAGGGRMGVGRREEGRRLGCMGRRGWKDSEADKASTRQGKEETGWPLGARKEKTLYGG